LPPGNLPALSQLFDVELVIVMETRLFDCVRRSPAFQVAEEFCTRGSFRLDDLLTGFPGDYGVVLTPAVPRFCRSPPHGRRQAVQR